jgi:hypothetical protein
MNDMTCPTCGSPSVQSRGKRHTLYPAGLVAIFGIALALLHSVSSPGQYHCNGCGADFAKRTATARIARVLVYIFAAGFTLYFLAAIIAVIVRSRS